MDRAEHPTRLKKSKTHGEVLFIDASLEFKEAKNQNDLAEEHLDKIVATFRTFETVDKHAYRASPQEPADKDCNPQKKAKIIRVLCDTDFRLPPGSHELYHR